MVDDPPEPRLLPLLLEGGDGLVGYGFELPLIGVPREDLEGVGPISLALSNASSGEPAADTWRPTIGSDAKIASKEEECGFMNPRSRFVFLA